MIFVALHVYKVNVYVAGFDNPGFDSENVIIIVII